MKWTYLSVAALVGAFSACSGDARPGLTVVTRDLPSPAGEGSGEPFLSSSGDAVYLSWLEVSPSGGHDLRFARAEGDEWSEPATIAHSEHFFVNWADFPSLTPGPDGTLWAHWLERGGEGTYDYGVRVVWSSDGGRHWSEPWTPHDDDTPTEHGFVSALPTADGMGFIWLDGRETAPGPDGRLPDAAMTLRYGSISADGLPGPGALIDDRVCDCCQTDVAVASSGPVAVYRDRTEDEIRDIYVTRFDDGAWTEGVPVHADEWKTAACPVNGPAVAARGDNVAVAWFTAVGYVPKVKIAFSSDGGASFGEPSVIDGGSPSGRVDLIMLEGGSVLVSWLEQTGGAGAEVRLRRVDPDGRASESVTVTESLARRASGFPRIIEAGDGSVLLAWTDVMGERSQVRVTRIDMEGS